MAKSNVRRMYAHVFFDIPENKLSVAVYAYGKVPGFSGDLPEELKSATGVDTAFKLFPKLLGPDVLSEKELQLGKIFLYNEMEDKLNKLDIIGKHLAKDKDADIVVNIDDPMFWFNSTISQLPKEKQLALSKLSEDRKIEAGKKIKQAALDECFKSDPEDLQDGLQKLYIIISRKLSTRRGPKEYAGTTTYKAPSPPAFLVSKDQNIAYYPGFRGAQYMTKTPSVSTMMYPTSEKDLAAKWYNVLLPDTKVATDGKPLSSIQIEPLDYISEILARMFFNNLPEKMEFSFADFNNATNPLISKAKILLEKAIGKDSKTASQKVGVWIDLFTGAVFRNKQQLIAAITSEDERLPLAAKLHNKGLDK